MAFDPTTLPTTAAQVQLIYTAYFGRAAEPLGLEFYVDALEARTATLEQDSGLSPEQARTTALIELGNQFAESQEAQANFPFLTDPVAEDAVAFVNNAFEFLFDRDAEGSVALAEDGSLRGRIEVRDDGSVVQIDDASGEVIGGGGLAFYVDRVMERLDRDVPELGEVIFDIIGGAQNDDVTALENKVQAAEAYTAELIAQQPDDAPLDNDNYDLLIAQQLVRDRVTAETDPDIVGQIGTEAAGSFAKSDTFAFAEATDGDDDGDFELGNVFDVNVLDAADPSPLEADAFSLQVDGDPELEVVSVVPVDRGRDGDGPITDGTGVGEAVEGNNGGTFTIAPDGSIDFDPTGVSSGTLETTVLYTVEATFNTDSPTAPDDTTRFATSEVTVDFGEGGAAGFEVPGDEDPGDQDPGDEDPGGEDPGGDDPGGDDPGGDDPGGDDPGGDDPGDPTPEPPVDDNTLPNAVEDTATTDEGASVTIDVLDNDTDPDNDPLNIADVTQPDNGSTSEQNGEIEYQPNDGFVGTDSFTYTVADGNGGTDTATVNVTVEATVETPLTVVALSSENITDEQNLNAYPFGFTSDQPFLEGVDSQQENPEADPTRISTLSYESFTNLALNEKGDVAFSANTSAPTVWLGELGSDSSLNPDDALWLGDYGETTNRLMPGIFVWDSEETEDADATEMVVSPSQEAATDRDTKGDLPALYRGLGGRLFLNDQGEVAFAAGTTPVKFGDDFRSTEGIFVEGNDPREVFLGVQPILTPWSMSEVAVDPFGAKTTDGNLIVVLPESPGPLSVEDSIDNAIYAWDGEGSLGPDGSSLTGRDADPLTKLVGVGDKTVDGREITDLGGSLAKYDLDPTNGDLLFLAELDESKDALVQRKSDGSLSILVEQGGNANGVDFNNDGNPEQFVSDMSSFIQPMRGGSSESSASNNETTLLAEFENPGPAEAERDLQAENDYLKDEFASSYLDPLGIDLSTFLEIDPADANFDALEDKTLFGMPAYDLAVGELYKSAVEPIPAITTVDNQDGSVDILARQGDPVPSADNHVLGRIEAIDANDAGEVAFYAETVPAGADFDNLGIYGPAMETGIFVVNRAGEINSIAREGQKVESEFWEGAKTIAGFEFAEIDINSDGTVAFVAKFADGTQGVLTTNRDDPGATLIGGEGEDVLTFQDARAEVAPYTVGSIGNDTLEFFTRDTDGSRGDGLNPSNADQVEFIGGLPTVESVELTNDGTDDQGNAAVDVIVSFQGGGSLNFADLLLENSPDVDTLFNDGNVDTSASGTNDDANVTDGETVTITGVSDAALQTIFGDSLTA